VLTGSREIEMLGQRAPHSEQTDLCRHPGQGLMVERNSNMVPDPIP